MDKEEDVKKFLVDLKELYNKHKFCLDSSALLFVRDEFSVGIVLDINYKEEKVMVCPVFISKDTD